MKNRGRYQSETTAVESRRPTLQLKRIRIVSRDFTHTFENGRCDFSDVLTKVLHLLDQNGCNAVIFSLFSIIPQHTYFLEQLNKLSLKHVKAIFLEEFKDFPRKNERQPGRYVVYHRSHGTWVEYTFYQRFGRLSDLPRGGISDFVSNILPMRMLGNCCVLLCGESNGVKYSKTDSKVHDTFRLREAIPPDVKIILNPVHDRMTRFEMNMKRQYLSEQGRWMISVWNKGKRDKNSKTRDGSGPAWKIFHDGLEKQIEFLNNSLGVELGVLDFEKE